MSYSSERRILLKKNNLCISCKNQDAYTLGGRSLCYDCAEKHRKDKRLKSKENLEKIKMKRKKYREKCIQEHRCVRCGKKLSTDYKLKTCKKCLYKCSITWRNYIIKLKGIDEWAKMSSRGENGLCWQCNKKPAQIGKLCKYCYEKQRKIAIENLKFVNKEKHIWRKQISYDTKTNKK